MKHVMIDIETMADLHNSAIVSIGAVRFDLETGKIGEEIEIDVDLQSCLDYGLQVTGGTIKWWLTRNEHARSVIAYSAGISLPEALLKLSKFINKDDSVWSNGLRFDVAIVENAYRTCKIPVPWDHHKEMDVRTLVSFAPEIKNRVVKAFTEPAHTPVNDCKKQILYCVETYNKLKI